MALTPTYTGQSISLFLALIFSSLFILALSLNTRYLATVETVIRWVTQPISMVANLPLFLSETTHLYFTSRAELEAENDQLRREMALGRVTAAELADTKRQLRELTERIADFRAGPTNQVVAEIRLVHPDRSRQEIVINRGLDDGVTLDSVVLDGRGVRGRTIEVFEDRSRVLQINDKRSGTPVLNVRTSQYFIASGNGSNEALSLDHVNINSDIKVGDELVTSGIGEVYPRGFLVGRVIEVIDETTQAIKQVKVEPSAQLDRKSYLRVVIREDSE